MTATSLIHLDGPATLQRFAEIQQVYTEVFPSYNLDDHAWRTTRQAKSRGFGAVLAEDDHNRIVGFVYGLPLGPRADWWAGMRPSPEPGFTSETGKRTCAVIDLAVLPAYRGQGLARRLMTEFLDSRSEERATLATEPRNQDVQAMYERWGWHKAGTVPGGEHETQAEFDLYVIALREAGAPTSSR